MKSILKNFLFICMLTLASLQQVHGASHIPANVLIRDAEIEQALQDFVGPLFKVAGLDRQQLKILVLNSTEVNAAAGLEYAMLINTGLIVKCNNVGQLIGVLAHETGHIAGRHNERLLNLGPQPFVPMIGALLLGGAVSALAGSPEPVMAALFGGMEMSENSVLAYHRSHEGAADQAAFKYLEKLGWSSQGFMEFMEELHKQELLSVGRQYAYKRTHPFMIDRMRLVETHCKNSKHTKASFPDNFDMKFQRIKVKIEAFIDSPHRVLQRYPASDTSLCARYGRAIAYHQMSQTGKSLAEIDQLLAEYPKDPFFLELKGQILFETGHVDEALELYKRAVASLPGNALLMTQLAHIMLESKRQDYSSDVIALLDKARAKEGDSPNLWRLYATAYGRQKQAGMVALMLAEEAVNTGDIEKAHKLADKAIKELPQTKHVHLQRARDIKTLEIPEKSMVQVGG